jgi:hypothetical protein
MLHVMGAKFQNVEFAGMGFTGWTDFTVAWYSTYQQQSATQHSVSFPMQMECLMSSTT